MRKIYIAIPYSGMRKSSYEQANQVTASVLNMGFNPFSPITHAHPLTDYDVPGNWEFWEKIDTDWIDICDEVWVFIPKEGIEKVKQSTGVQAELKYAIDNNKPVRVLEKDRGHFVFAEKLNDIIKEPK